MLISIFSASRGVPVYVSIRRYSMRLPRRDGQAELIYVADYIPR